MSGDQPEHPLSEHPQAEKNAPAINASSISPANHQDRLPLVVGIVALLLICGCLSATGGSLVTYLWFENQSQRNDSAVAQFATSHPTTVSTPRPPTTATPHPTAIATPQTTRPATSYPGEGGDEGLVAYYPFNGNADDESGNGHHGTVLGAVLTEDRLGKTDSAYSFDGKDNYIEVAHDSNLNPTEEISLAAWIWARQYGFYPTIVLKGNMGNYDESYALYLTPENRLGCYLNRDGTPGGRTTNELGPVIPLRTWTHVACTYDGDTIRTYINGNQVGNRGHRGGIFITPDPMVIGKSEREASDYPTTFFNGSIDEVKIYNRSLSPREIRNMASDDR